VLQQAARFVDVMRRGDAAQLPLWRGGVALPELQDLLARMLGQARAEGVLADYRNRQGGAFDTNDPGLLQHVEAALAGSIGSASARILVESIARESPLGIEDVMHILDETSQVIHYSRELARRTEELREANRRLQEVDRIKDDFISTVTHELRTPLTSIRAFSEILSDNPGLELAERQRYLGIVTRETERLTRLINQVLDFAKLEQGDVDWQVEPVVLKDVIHDAANATAQLYVEAGVALDVEAIDARLRVRADRDRLQQVLLNLLGNAVKFAPRGRGRVQLSAGVTGTEACIRVRDNGPGIDPREQAVIFEKFRQAGSHLTAKPSGTGLGLAISRRIVERLGGRIWVESTEGAGAVFQFTVPLAEGSGGAS
jgi:signal transduction histidine kinase